SGLQNLVEGDLLLAAGSVAVHVERLFLDETNAARLGDTQLALHQYEQAAETFRQVGEIGPHLIQANYKRGIALAASKRLAEAEAVFAAI
ncbi:cellulose biosynthesis protein, partial [Rhizobium ruizarguesonis]